MPKVQCPQCKAVAALPEELVGRRVRCKSCSAAFLADPMRASQGGDGETDFTGSVSATSVNLPPLPSPKRKPARERQAAGGGSGAVWVLLAMVAFFVPVAGASTFAALKWKRSAPEARAADEAPGQVIATMEIGSSAVTFVVFKAYPSPDGGEPELRKVEDANAATGLTDRMAATGSFSDEGLQKTVKAIKGFQEQFKKKYTRPEDVILVVGSSGLLDPIRNDKKMPTERKLKLLMQNAARLKDELAKETGVDVELIEPQEEAALALRGVMRARDVDSGVYVEVGSGSTRGGYLTKEGRLHRLQGVPGLRRIRDGMTERLKAPPKKKNTPAKNAAPIAAAELVSAELRPALRKEVARDPEFQQRDQVYLLGGITWVMATCQHPRKCTGRGDRHVKITAADVASFREKVFAAPDHYLKSYKIPDGLSDEAKEELEMTLERMKKIYPTREHLVAGAELLYAVTEELELARKTVWFDRFGHVAWVWAKLDKAVPSQ